MTALIDGNGLKKNTFTLDLCEIYTLYCHYKGQTTT